MNYTKKLERAVKAVQSCLCVGLDPNLDLIPASVKSKEADPCRQVTRFLKGVIDSTQEFCAAYKPNLGFFEALGPQGLQVFQEIIEYIPDGKVIIAGTSISTLTLGYYFLSRRSKLSSPEMGEHVSEIADWADHKGKSAIARSINQMQQLQYNVREQMHYHLPDLYKATEHISLSRQTG